MDKDYRNQMERSWNLRHALILILLLIAILTIGSTVLAQGRSIGQANRETTASPDARAQVFNRVLRESMPISPRVTIPGAPGQCLADLSGLDGCSANDFELASATVQLPLVDDCDALGTDTVTFTANFLPDGNADRYDVGIYFATNGSPSALTGSECSVSSLDIPPHPDLETAAQLPANKDLCGDYDSDNPIAATVTITAKCVDNNGDGRLDLPYCLSYDNNSNTKCTAPLPSSGNSGVVPGTSSKCFCDNSFSVDVPVPDLVLDVTKTADQTNVIPGNNVTYTITYKNVPNGFNTETAINLTMTDVLNSNLTFVSASPPIGEPGSCAHTGPNPGGTVTCTGLDPLAPNETGTITLVAKVEINSNTIVSGFQLPNTACVTGNTSTNTNLAEDCGNVAITTPVTVAYFKATETSDGMRFDWTTASETSNAGFNLYVKTVDGLELVNDPLILSRVFDSQEPQDYSFEVSGLAGETFYIEDVGLFGENRLHGPFAVNQAFGEPYEPDPIDWEAIAAENRLMERERASDERNKADRGQGIVNANAISNIELRVKKDGIYRVTYEQLKAATGVDLKGVDTSTLALTNRGEPVPIYVSGRTFGSGEFIEFYGEGLDTLYTDTNVYILQVNPALASRVAVSRAKTLRNPTYPAYYLETGTVEANKSYSYLSPNGDPWYDTFLVAQKATSWTFNLNIDNYVSGGPAAVNVSLWGASNQIPGADHHILVGLNGQQVDDRLYDNLDVININAPLPAGLLKEGVNSLVLTKPFDTGAKVDASGLESYGVTYPRAFVARNGQLSFDGTGSAFRVTNLPSNQVVVYRIAAGRPARLNGASVQSANGAYQVTFPGEASEAKYLVSTVNALAVPEMAVARTPETINDGQASLLVISHPNFIGGLDSWVQARKSKGYTVKVVDVRDVYATYSGGVFDAEAIGQYIRYAINNLGVKYVTLIGGDTSNYRNYGGGGSISFIPSLYANTITGVYFAPVDPLYTDIDGDNVPDAAIGRFPVRTLAELQMMIEKTLQYDARSTIQTAIFTADEGFEGDSDTFSMSLVGWNVLKSYPSQLGFSSARANLIAGLNQGPRLASFVGHSSRSNWTAKALFNASDAAALTNFNAPTLVTQWGCWNTYYVDPAYNTLGHKFLLSGMNGAAAVTGASTLTSNASERALGHIMMPRIMAPGTPIGAAMLSAKQDLATTNPEMKDVLLGWTILGDPTIVNIG